MGHRRLPRLPKTRPWREVIALLGRSEIAADPVAQATMRASERELQDAAGDPALLQAFFLLSRLPLAAREASFGANLRELGLSDAAADSLLSLQSAFGESVDAHARTLPRRTDLGEMAQLAATETLGAAVRQRGYGLFEADADRLRSSLGALATEAQFAGVAREFFSRLLNRYLRYNLDRAVPHQLGKTRGINTLEAQSEFNEALRLHCWEASKIVEDFAGQWISKKRFEGGITPGKSAYFVKRALKKLSDELARRGGPHGS